jgi:hypothetical protein
LQRAATSTLVDRLRQHLIAGGEAGRITPAILLLVLDQFVDAELEIGNDPQALMQALMEKDSETLRAGSNRSVVIRL